MQYKVVESHAWKPHISKCMPLCTDATCWCNKDFTQCVQNPWEVPLDYLWCQYFSCLALIPQLFWLFIRIWEKVEIFLFTRTEVLQFICHVGSCVQLQQWPGRSCDFVQSCGISFSLIHYWIRGTKGCEEGRDSRLVPQPVYYSW